MYATFTVPHSCSCSIIILIIMIISSLIFFQYLAVWEELKAVVDGMGMIKSLGSPGSGTSPTRKTALPLSEEKSPFT